MDTSWKPRRQRLAVFMRWLMKITNTRRSSHVLTKKEFQRALHREWSRSQRIDLPVVLVTIEASQSVNRDSPGVSPDRILDAYIRQLGGRLRCTDIVGWRGGLKLGVLLPHTSGADAWRIMLEVQGGIERSLGVGLRDMVDLKVYASNESDLQVLTMTRGA